LLEVKALSTYYGSIRALNQVSLSIQTGEIVAVIGANGAGKSTLLRSISGLAPNESGLITYMDQNISHLEAHKIVKLGIGHALEGKQIFGLMTVLENLRIGAYPIRGKGKLKIQEKLEYVYTLFPILEKRLGQKSATLSGGEQQMLSIGRCLMADPRLLLLDEPSLGLAPKVVETIFEVLIDLNKRGLTLLLVEQNAALALETAGRAYVLETGRVVLEGECAAVRADEAVVSHYLGARKGDSK
jgi:branched-chain amino acid transport system ATP-binding protein